MHTREFTLNFSKEWIWSWNNRDIDVIIDHYSDSIDFKFLFIIQMNADPNGKIKNKIVLKIYFLKALNKYEDLHFELLKLLIKSINISWFVSYLL